MKLFAQTLKINPRKNAQGGGGGYLVIRTAFPPHSLSHTNTDIKVGRSYTQSDGIYDIIRHQNSSGIQELEQNSLMQRPPFIYLVNSLDFLSFITTLRLL